MVRFLESLNKIVWGGPTLILLLGAGLYLTIRTGFAQFRLLPRALAETGRKFFCRQDSKTSMSSRRALCTALAATVGTGNLAGVAGAIAIGGPGVLFWMWVCALGGMILKFSEAVLSVRFRDKNFAGEAVGGPMYMIQNGLGHKLRFLAYIYCFFGIVAALGVGNATQINTLVGSVNQLVITGGGNPSALGNTVIGCVVAVVVGMVFLGGAKRVGAATEKVIPFVSVVYVLLCVGALIMRRAAIANAFKMILCGVLDPAAVTGGVVVTVFRVVSVGVSRGVFTNEAGMGTAGIAHGAADVRHPVQQGLMGIIEVFLDTIVICTLTGLVILCSGINVPYGIDSGIGVTLNAFSSVYGDGVCVVLALCVCFFAFATVLGWGLYGGRCAQYLFGERAWRSFAVLQLFTVILGAVMKTHIVWLCSEIVNGLMAVPSLIAILGLSRHLNPLIRQYKQIS